MFNFIQKEEDKKSKIPSFKFKTGEHSYCFKQFYNDYLIHQRKKNLQLQLILNPNKLFLEDIYQKKKEFDMKKENMNILTDLFDGKIMDVDQQKYLNTNSKYNIGFRTKTNKISQFLLFKTNGIFRKSKKKIHKSFSQNLIQNNINNKIIPFPTIYIKEKPQSKIETKKRSLVINTNYTFYDKPIIKEKKKLSLNTNYFFDKKFRIFNTYKANYYRKLNSLTTDSKILAKNLSLFSLKGISHI